VELGADREGIRGVDKATARSEVSGASGKAGPRGDFDNVRSSGKNMAASIASLGVSDDRSRGVFRVVGVMNFVPLM